MDTLIFGHKNPDTDSICSALSYAFLKNEIGEPAIPCSLGAINSETGFVLDYFNIKKPSVLSNVYTQVSDLNMNTIEPIRAHNSYFYAYKKMGENKSNTIAVVDKQSKILGILTIKDIAMELITGNFSKLDTYIVNIVNQLEAIPVNAPETNLRISGTVVIATDQTDKIDEIYSPDNIVISGDIDAVNEALINKKVKLLISCSQSKFPDHLSALAKKNDVLIIQTRLGTYHVSKLIQQCNLVEGIMKRDSLISFSDDSIVEEIKETMISTNYRNYPVTDKNGKYKGFISRKHLLSSNKKNVILVDHNEYNQSVLGLEDANILEVIDHHKLGGLNTISPINFTNAPVGSTCTLIYEEFKKNSVIPPYGIAGLMLSGIISDTLLFKSPTCTKRDILAVKELNLILNLDIDKYFSDMYNAASSITDFSPETIIYTDYKEFNHHGKKFAVSQIFTSDIDYIKKIQESLVDKLNSINKTLNFEFSLLVITDILLEGSYFISAGISSEKVSSIMDSSTLNDLPFSKAIVSRKKQIIPTLLQFMDEN